MKVKRLKTGRWQARWRDKDNVQRSRNFVERPSMEELAALEREEQDASTVQWTFAAFAKMWLETHAPLTRCESLRETDAGYIRDHLNPLFGERLLTDLRKAHLVAAKPVLAAKLARPTRQKTGAKLKPKTVNHILTLAKRIMETATDLELIQGNPWAKVAGLKVPKQVREPWTPTEKRTFLEYCRRTDPGFAELVLVAMETGLRKGELQALQAKELDFERGCIWVRRSLDSRGRPKPDDGAKNGDVNGSVPMSAAVRETLRNRQGAVGSVFDRSYFPDYYGRLQRRAKTAGLRRTRFHDLRHAFGTHLTEAGESPFVVKSLMRHSSLAMTEQYVHVSPSTLATAMSAFGVHSELQENRQAADD